MRLCGSVKSHNGIDSTIAITDQTQTAVNKYAYTPFGIIANEEETIIQPFKYVGQYGVITEPNGFYYMRARYYDPTVGRFISEDPSGFGGGDVNLYAYVGNNPIMFVDPSGLHLYRNIFDTSISHEHEGSDGSDPYGLRDRTNNSSSESGLNLLPAPNAEAIDEVLPKAVPFVIRVILGARKLSVGDLTGIKDIYDATNKYVSPSNRNRIDSFAEKISAEREDDSNRNRYFGGNNK